MCRKYFKILFIFNFLKLLFCQSSFDIEYPGVKICLSGNLQDSSIHESEVRRKGISYLMSSNCTHLQESLYIRGLKGIKVLTLDSIKEIDGHLIIEGNDVEEISMKNLVIIRGYASKSYRLFRQNQQVNISLQVTGNQYLRNLNISQLRSIYNHDVLFDNNPRLKYLPHKIKWDELFTKQKNQKLHTNAVITDVLLRDACSSDCTIWPKTNVSFCWGPLKNQCQMKTLCEQNSDDCDICFYKDGLEKNCCDQLCIGGCRKVGPENCNACKNMLNGKRCVETCPSRYIGGISGTIFNPAFKYVSGSFCSTKCPEYMLIEETTCVHACSVGYFKNEMNQCIRCYGDKCKRLDIPCDWMNMTLGDQQNFILSAQILTQLTNCTKLRGYILLTKRSFTEFGVTVKMLYDHLSNLEELEGGFSYYVDNHLKNLTFLANLKIFRHAHLHGNIQGIPEYNKFSIVDTSLDFLGLKSLKHVTGRVFIVKNKNLCYLNVPWKEMGSENVHIQSKNCDGLTCDKECSNKGCWMAGNEWCCECRHFEAGGRCVSSCNSTKGYFLDSASNVYNGTCVKCDEECGLTCNGTTAVDCIGGCVHKEENGVCVNRCSFRSFEQKGTNKCLACNKICAITDNSPQCTGPSDKVGLGGCNKCQHILINRTRGPVPKEHIVKCVSECPYKTFARASENEQITKYFLKNGYLCEPCNPLCSKCIGRQPNRDDCSICEGYWNRNTCVKLCPKASTYGFNSSRHCLQCDAACSIGCSGPTAWNCEACRDRKVPFNETSFRCQKSCPDDKNIEEMDKSSRQIVCKNIWESTSKKEELRRRKIVIFSILMMFFVVIVTIVGIVVCLRKKALSDRFETELKARYSNLTEPNSKDEQAFSKPPNMGRLVIISMEDLIFEDESKPLGCGAFGYVYKGKWKIPKDDDMIIKKATAEFHLPVAIKVIKTIGNRDGDAILQEAKIMSSVSHMHCLRFIGICLSYEKPCLVTAFVKEGSLDKFLVRSRSKITSLIMLSWAEQIADGMFYLTKRGIIHRDLATRNVLVSRLECVQITDFGLSKMLENTKDKEIIIKSGKVPIRWLAIETLLEGKYSYETDVWAYGVTIWEIFTFGKTPYDDQATEDISNFVMKGGRLSQPDICSLDVYIVMVNCWLESPNLRPDFESLMKTFVDYCKNPGRYLSIQGDPFEIPSPTNIEMTNLNNPYGNHFNFSPGTAETMLPLLSGRDSIDVAHATFSQDSDGLPQREDEMGNLVNVSDNEDLPTRSATRTNNLFKRFQERSISSNTPTNHNNNSNTVTSNNSARLLPLTSLEQPTVKASSLDEDPRYVADPTDKVIKLRDIQQNHHPRTHLSETPRFHSNPLLKMNHGLSYNLPPPPKAPNLNCQNDYLEPIKSNNTSHREQCGNDVDGYLEPVSTKNKDLNQDEYLTSSNKKKYNNNNNKALTNTSNVTPTLASTNEEPNPDNLNFPQNLVDDEYLEPNSKTVTK